MTEMTMRPAALPGCQSLLEGEELTNGTHKRSWSIRSSGWSIRLLKKSAMCCSWIVWYFFTASMLSATCASFLW